MRWRGCRAARRESSTFSAIARLKRRLRTDRGLSTRRRSKPLHDRFNWATRVATPSPSPQRPAHRAPRDMRSGSQHWCWSARWSGLVFSSWIEIGALSGPRVWSRRGRLQRRLRQLPRRCPHRSQRKWRRCHLLPLPAGPLPEDHMSSTLSPPRDEVCVYARGEVVVGIVSSCSGPTHAAYLA